MRRRSTPAVSKLLLSVKLRGRTAERRGKGMCKTMLKGLSSSLNSWASCSPPPLSLGCCFFRCPKPQARKCVHGDSRKSKPQPINRSQVSLAHDTLPEGAFSSQSLLFPLLARIQNYDHSHSYCPKSHSRTQFWGTV